MEPAAIVTFSLLFVALYFEVFLLVSFTERLMRRSPSPRAASRTTGDAATLPSATIVVPCFNGKRGIAATLDSLLALDYPAEKLHIIVVDDGSTDDTLAIARHYASDRITVLHKENGGKHTAMNMALAHAHTDLLGCLDADSTVAKDALARIAPLFSDARVGAVTPGILVKDPGNILQHLQRAEYFISLFSRFMLASLGSAFITPGPFSIFRTSVVRELGGWRYAHATEDMELALRIQERGYLIGNAPRASVHTTTPRTVRALVKQRTRWAYGGLRNLFDFRHLLGNRAYGNLGLFILLLSIISIGTSVYFFLRLLWGLGESLANAYLRFSLTGSVPAPRFSLFYINTSMLWLLIGVAITLVLIVMSAGSWLGTGSRRLTPGTIPFLAFYSFLAPLWVCAAPWRIVVGAGIRWR